MKRRQMSGGGRSKRLQKTYPFGRVCEARGCTTRLSIYNRDELCARCEEVERRDLLDAERLERLVEAARA
jgi:hypothetical protein